MMMSLHEFLTGKANEMAPIDPECPDCRHYSESVNVYALSEEWLENNTSYIWKVGVLAQWDSNKCDYARLFIGHERKPGIFDFIGMLHWPDGENDDPGRCLARAAQIAANIHPVWEPR